MKDDPADERVAAVVTKLAEARKRKGLSKNKLAQMAGVDPRTVAFVENRERNPTLYTLFKIAIALNIKLAPLISEAERNK